MPPKPKKKKRRVKPKNVSKKKAVSAKELAKKNSPKKSTSSKRVAPKKSAPPGKRLILTTARFEPAGLGSRSAGQSGNLQGLSDVASADSESVDELLEEGNAFEAEVIEGVEDAPDADRGEVKTREVPGDDVPDEYLDNDN